MLSAVVDHGFDRYLSTKRAAEPVADPVDDLRRGWSTDAAFALDHPAVYRLMYPPAFTAVPAAAGEALRLRHEVLVRCAAADRLRVAPEIAAQTIMSANVGVSLALVDPGDHAHDRAAALGAAARDAEPGPHRGGVSDADRWLRAVAGRTPPDHPSPRRAANAKHPAVEQGACDPRIPGRLAALDRPCADAAGFPGGRAAARAGTRSGAQDWMKARRSALIVSASVVGIPCGKPE